MKKAVALSILIAAMSLAAVVIAEARQPTQVPRIGFLGAPPVPPFRNASRHSGKVCASLVMSRAKTLALSGDMQKEN
jgi:hypothetical protein